MKHIQISFFFFFLNRCTGCPSSVEFQSVHKFLIPVYHLVPTPHDLQHKNLMLLPPVYVLRREVMFSQVCVCSNFGRGGTPSQVWMGGTPFPGLYMEGGTSSGVWTGGVPHPRSGWGTPWAMTGWGTPQPGLDGAPLLSRTRWGYPPPQLDRAALRALATRRAVCLLRSCRRTFLFAIFLE